MDLSNYEYVQLIWVHEKETALYEDRAPLQLNVAAMTGVSTSEVSDILRGVKRRKGRGKPTVISPESRAVLESLIERGEYGYDRSLTHILGQIMGERFKRLTISRVLNEGLDGGATKRIKRDAASKDKYTDKQLLRLREMAVQLKGVDRSRFRFYDQTGLKSEDLLPEKFRVFADKTKPLPHAPRLPSSR